eukprot:766741-Hanusia_phi.AAC.7
MTLAVLNNERRTMNKPDRTVPRGAGPELPAPDLIKGCDRTTVPGYAAYTVTVKHQEVRRCICKQILAGVPAATLRPSDDPATVPSVTL